MKSQKSQTDLNFSLCKKENQKKKKGKKRLFARTGGEEISTFV